MKSTFINNWEILTKKWSNGKIYTVATLTEPGVNGMVIINWNAKRIYSEPFNGKATAKTINKLHLEFIENQRVNLI